MHVFINECSLNEQFENHNLIEALRTFLRTIKAVNQFSDRFLYKSILFFNFKALKNTLIETSLKSNNELNNVFSQNLKSAMNWEKVQIHEKNSSYIYDNKEYVKTSIAEITERKLINPSLKAILINFIDSKFSDNIYISVQKNGNINTKISCAFNETSIHEWLIVNKFIDPKKEYNENIGFPPLDGQTVLCDTKRFILTKWRNGKSGRKVYKLKDTNQLWVVDNSLRHSTNRAHIEVFDETTKKHLGTSIYNKINLDSKYADKKRTINLC